MGEPEEEEDFEGLWLGCNECLAWMHGPCVGFPTRAPPGGLLYHPYSLLAILALVIRILAFVLNKDRKQRWFQQQHPDLGIIQGMTQETVAQYDDADLCIVVRATASATFEKHTRAGHS